MVFLRVEQILRQLRLARQQTESFRFRDGRPETIAPANGAIAAIGALCEIQIRLEGDGTAMTTALIGL